METIPLSELFIQLPVLGVVLGVSFYLLKTHKEERAEWNETWIKYLGERNSKVERFMESSVKTMEGIQHSNERMLRVLIKVARTHKLEEDADNLMDS